MADLLAARILLPKVTDPDVRKVEVSYTINDGDTNVLTDIDPLTPHVGVKVDQDAKLFVVVKWLDDNENSSANSRTFIVTDTIAPARPGQIGLEIVGEEVDGVASGEPTPEPEPEPEPTPEPEPEPTPEEPPVEE